MNKNDIIESLNKHIKYTNNNFYKKCLDHITTFDTNNDILETINDNKYILESIRITLLYNNNKYYLYLSNEKHNDSTNYQINTSDDIKSKLIYQVSCATKSGNILGLENDQYVPEMKFNKLHIVISNRQINGLYKLSINSEVLGYIFGIEIFNVLKYQKLDRIIEFIKKFKDGDTNGYYIMENYLKHLKKYDWQFRDNIVIINNTVLNILGLTEKKKIEILGLFNWDFNNAHKLAHEFDDNTFAIITTNNNKLVDKKGNCLKYNYRWLTYTLPASLNIEYIGDIIYDPEYTFYFMGIKFMSLNYIFNKMMFEYSTKNYVDFLMLKNINEYNVIDKLCIPNMSVVHGKIKVFDKDVVEKLYTDIINISKHVYGVNIEKNYLTKTIYNCNEHAFEIYQGLHVYDPDTSIIKKFHRDVKLKIFYEYCKNKKYLLDIGSGQLTDSIMWNKVNIEYVFGIEPSSVSIENGSKRLQKYGTTTKINIVNGLGNDVWKNNKKYDIILANKYDIITFQFTIHYMIHDIDIVMNNINALCKFGTLVLITCMDGNLISNELHKKGFIEVRNEIEPLFAIYPKKYSDEVLVYFKGAFGLGGDASSERLVDPAILIQIFAKYNFGLVRQKRFLDYNSRVKDNMNNTQKNVSHYYTSIIFIKK
jgi:SAM-dependent methyltransferase